MKKKYKEPEFKILKTLNDFRYEFGDAVGIVLYLLV